MSDRVLDVENLTVDIPLATGILHAVDGVNLHVDLSLIHISEPTRPY